MTHEPKKSDLGQRRLDLRLIDAMCEDFARVVGCVGHRWRLIESRILAVVGFVQRLPAI